MRVMLLEDEPPAMAQLEAAVLAWSPDVTIAARAESVSQAARLLAEGPEPDLIFADIHLTDGSSLQLFGRVNVGCPVVFATAYDAYVQRALELNAIDYLLKPIDPARVAAALDKYLRLRAHFTGRLREVARATAGPRTRLVVRKGADFVAVPVEQIAWFTSEEKITVLVDRDGRRALADETLAELEAALDARRFFRANRQYLVSVDAVRGFRPSGKGKLTLTLAPRPEDDVIVSQERAGLFKAWIEGRG